MTLEQCLPTDRAAQIQDLFTRVGQPEFAAVFDRAYRVRERSGLRSWLGMDGERAVLHISVAPQEFSDGTATVQGGFLGDLMADDSQRDFWGPVKLARQMVGDVRKAGKLSFLLTTYLPAAESVFKAAGFKPFAMLRRYVMPLAWPYLLWRRIRLGRLPRLTTLAFNDPRLGSLIERLPSPGMFRTRVSTEYYTTRMPRSEYPEGVWLMAGTDEAPEALVLMCPLPDGYFAVPDLLWRDTGVPLEKMLVAAGSWARRQGGRVMFVSTLDESAGSALVQRAGFVARPDQHGLMMLQLGAAAAPPAAEWCLTQFAGTAW